MINTWLTNQIIIKVKYIYKKTIITEKLNFPCCPSCLERKKTECPSAGCQQFFAGLMQEVTTVVSVSAISVSHPEDSIHTSLVTFSSSYTFFFHKIPQVLVRKDDTHVPFMAGHLKMTYLSAESSYRSLDSFLTTANRKEPLAPKLTTPLSMGRGTVI